MSLKFTKLTRDAMRRLAIGESLHEHNIVVERTTKGDLRFKITATVDGRRISKAVGFASAGVTREQAEMMLETYRTRAREDRLDLPTGRKTHLSFAEAAAIYVARLEETNGKGLAIKRRHLRMYLKPAFGRDRLDRLSEYALQKYRADRRRQEASEATINRELATVSHLLRAAVRWKLMPADRMPFIPMAREARQAVTILTDDQARALLECAANDADPWLWLFVTFGLNAAMRHREILSVRFEEIDFKNRRIHIPSAKAGSRDQPITNALVGAIRHQQEVTGVKDGWVFPSIIPAQSTNGHRTNMARPFARAVVAAGLDSSKVTPHTMRHTLLHAWFWPVSICQPYSGSADTKPWLWCCGTRTYTVPISTKLSTTSTSPRCCLHQNYTSILMQRSERASEIAF